MRAALVTALMLAAPASCGTPTTPAPARVVVFTVETLTPQLEHIKKRVSLTITAIQADGSVANVTERGYTRPGPLELIISTPYRHAETLAPGVVAVSITVLYLGDKGDIVQCVATVDDHEVDRDVVQVAVVGSGGRGSAKAHCAYAGG